MTPEEQKERLRSVWNAPKRHLLLKSPTGTEWLAVFEKLKAQLGSGFLIGLVGVRGNGKTQLGVNLMWEATENLHSALYTTAIGFFMEIKESYQKANDLTEIGVFSKFKRPFLLVIDEIGKRAETSWENNLLFELLNYRYNNLKDTILIDNRTKTEFVEFIGPSVASRMNETGGIIECTWETFRK